jgi:putative flippase GtrA
LHYIRKHRNFILYLFIGSIAFSLDAAVFFLLSDVLKINYIAANCAGVFIGILVSFILNSRYNFKKLDSRFKRLLSFAAVCLMGMMLGTLILSFFYEILFLAKFPSKLFSVMLAGIFQYFFNKNVTFR